MINTFIKKKNDKYVIKSIINIFKKEKILFNNLLVCIHKFIVIMYAFLDIIYNLTLFKIILKYNLIKHQIHINLYVFFKNKYKKLVHLFLKRTPYFYVW